MNINQQQLSLGFDELVNAANEATHNLGPTYSIGKVRRTFPLGIAALSVVEVKRIMNKETAACGRLNSLYGGIFDEVLHRCAPLGIDYLGLRIIDTESIPLDGCPLTLEMACSPQICLEANPCAFGEIVESVKVCILEVCAELNDAYSAIQSVLDRQERSEECHPINVISENDGVARNEDSIEVKSKSIAEYIEKSLLKRSLVEESTLIVDGYAPLIEPPETLFKAMADDPVPERQIIQVNDVYVRSAFGEANGEYYIKVDGAVVDRTARAVEMQIDPNQVFDDRMRNAARRVNVKYLYQLNEKVVDLSYVRCKRRVTRPSLESKHEIVLKIENIRKVHEIRQSQMNGPVSSLDTIVAERSGLL